MSEREEFLNKLRAEWVEASAWDDDSEEVNHLHELLNEAYNAGHADAAALWTPQR